MLLEHLKLTDVTTNPYDRLDSEMQEKLKQSS